MHLTFLFLSVFIVEIYTECGWTNAMIDKYRQEALNKHNELRIRHGVPPLVLDSRLNTYAQAWANHMAKSIQQLQHRPRSGRWKQLYGENINWSSHRSFSGDEFANGMYNRELPFWNWNSNSFIYKAGHFTQIIWKNSCRLGVGFSFTPDCRSHYTSFNYDPAGNYENEFRDNVPQIGASRSRNNCASGSTSGSSPSGSSANHRENNHTDHHLCATYLARMNENVRKFCTIRGNPAACPKTCSGY